MNAFLSKGIAVILFSFQSIAAVSQLDLSKYQIGVTAGFFVYQGDLTPSRLGSFQTMRFTGSLFISRILNPSFSLRTNLAFGSITASDANYAKPEWRRQRNFNFSSPVFEISELLVYNFNSRKKISPYVFAGPGISFVNISRDYSNFNSEYFGSEPELRRGLNTDIEHSLPRIVPVLPLGVGIQYNLTDNISLVAESSYRLSLNDYIDGFSRSANPTKYDHYQNYSVGAVLRFAKRRGIDCPVKP
jgi:hypothetical protein